MLLAELDGVELLSKNWHDGHGRYLQNAFGGLPVRNFSAGQMVDVSTGEKFKMGGGVH